MISVPRARALLRPAAHAFAFPAFMRAIKRPNARPAAPVMTNAILVTRARRVDGLSPA